MPAGSAKESHWSTECLEDLRHHLKLFRISAHLECCIYDEAGPTTITELESPQKIQPFLAGLGSCALGNLTTKNTACQHEECGLLPKSHALLERYKKSPEPLPYREFILGLTCSQTYYVWAAPLVYFDRLLGFFVVGGADLEKPFTQLSSEEINQCRLLLSQCSTSEQLVPAPEKLPLKRIPDIFELMELTVRNLLQVYHHQFRRQFSLDIHHQLQESFKAFLDHTESQTIPKDPRDWAKQMYQVICEQMVKDFQFKHCGMMTYVAGKGLLCLVGCAPQKNDFPFKLDDGYDPQDKKIPASMLFQDMALQKRTQEKDYLLISNQLSKEWPEKCGTLDEQFGRGIWFPLIVQERCVGVFRALKEKDSFPFSELDKKLWIFLLREVNRYIETIVGYFREMVIAQLKNIFPAYTQTEQEFFETAANLIQTRDVPVQFPQKNNTIEGLNSVARYARRLINCRGIVIRLRSWEKPQLFRVVGCNDFLRKKHYVQQYPEEADALLSYQMVNPQQETAKEAYHIFDLNAPEVVKKLSESQKNIHTELDLHYLLAVPLKNEEQRVIGFLNCYQQQYHPFTFHEIASILDFSKHLTGFLKTQEQHWLLEKERRNAINEILFYEKFSQAINQASNIEKMLEGAHQVLQEFHFFEQFAIWFCDPLPHYPFMEAVYQAQAQTTSNNLNRIESHLKSALNYWQKKDQKAYEKIVKWIKNLIPQPALSQKREASVDEMLRIVRTKLIGVKDPLNFLFPNLDLGEIKELLEQGLWQQETAREQYHFFVTQAKNLPANTETRFTLTAQELKNLLQGISGTPFPAWMQTYQAALLRSSDGNTAYGLCSFLVPTTEITHTIRIREFIARTLANRIEKIHERELGDFSAQLAEFNLFDDRHEFCTNAVEKIREILKAKACMILSIESNDSNKLHVRGLVGFSKPSAEQMIYDELSTTLYVFKYRRSIRLNDIRWHSYCRMPFLQAIEGERPFTHWCGVPIFDLNRECIGMIKVLDKQDSSYPHFTQHDQKILERFAEKIGQFLTNYDFLKTRWEITAKVAHGSRSPLQNILNWSENAYESLLAVPEKLVRQSPPLQNAFEKLKIANQKIFDNVTFAQKFVDTAITSSRVIYQPLEPEQPQEIDLSRMLERLTELWEAYSRRYHKEIVLENVQDLPKFEGESRKIELLIYNILDNALKYSYANRQIEITGKYGNNWVRLEFVNFGQRAYQSEAERIALLNPFIRSASKDEKRYIFGTGLGLPLCHEIVAHLRGKLDIQTRPSSGANRETGERYWTTVTIEWPIRWTETYKFSTKFSSPRPKATPISESPPDAPIDKQSEIDLGATHNID